LKLAFDQPLYGDYIVNLVAIKDLLQNLKIRNILIFVLGLEFDFGNGNLDEDQSHLGRWNP
jgi:hypothetical protein